MKTFFLTILVIVSLLFCFSEIQGQKVTPKGKSFPPDIIGDTLKQAQTTHTQLTNLPIESKLDWATWRTDIYICTGIAFARSIGMTANDFAVFVGNQHSITSPNDTSISSVIKTLNMLFTTYPKGKFELLTESNLIATMKWNRPYSTYFENGLVFGVSLEEFESVLYGHAIIMTKRIGIDFKYDIKGDNIFCTLKRYR